MEVGRSDTCKKHGGAEKVRKALVNLLNVHEHNPSVTKTKRWEQIRLRHRPNSSNIKIGIIKTNAIRKTYLQEACENIDHYEESTWMGNDTPFMETEYTGVFRDKYPCTAGHTLFIPKKNTPEYVGQSYGLAYE